MAPIKKRRMNKTQTAEINAIVGRFLKLGEPWEKNTVHGRKEPFGETVVQITGNNGTLNITYEFTRKEVAILQTISEVSGVPIEWLAKDALNWFRSYVAELPINKTGQVFDLLDDDGAATNAIPAKYRNGTRAFIDALKKSWP